MIQDYFFQNFLVQLEILDEEYTKFFFINIFCKIP